MKTKRDAETSKIPCGETGTELDWDLDNEIDSLFQPDYD